LLFASKWISWPPLLFHLNTAFGVVGMIAVLVLVAAAADLLDNHVAH
jgi:hypothetical protein